jgi:hypothetical protein
VEYPLILDNGLIDGSRSAYFNVNSDRQLQVLLGRNADGMIIQRAILYMAGSRQGMWHQPIS